MLFPAEIRLAKQQPLLYSSEIMIASRHLYLRHCISAAIIASLVFLLALPKFACNATSSSFDTRPDTVVVDADPGQRATPVNSHHDACIACITLAHRAQPAASSNSIQDLLEVLAKKMELYSSPNPILAIPKPIQVRFLTTIPRHVPSLGLLNAKSTVLLI